MAIVYIQLPDGSTSEIDSDAAFGQWGKDNWYVGWSWLGEIQVLSLDWSRGKPNVTNFPWYLDRSASMACIAIVEAHLKLYEQPEGTFDLAPPEINWIPIVAGVGIGIAGLIGIAYAYKLFKGKRRG